MGFFDKLEKAIKNADWEEIASNAVNSFEKQLDKNVDGVVAAYKKKIREVSDSQVLYKLSEAEEKMDTDVGMRIYDVTYAEARRRGLV